MQLVECIPNFSEGRDQNIIESIQSAIESVSNVWLLHVDVGYDANRTVFTFVGDINTIGEAAFRAIQVASQLIDMSKHQGEHPRMGACDVCPLVPLGDTQMADVVVLSHQLGKRLGEEGIPVFMYEASARLPERKNLAFLRKGEYEALPKKLLLDTWKPDYGPVVFNDGFGAVVIGARHFLIAYNINLESKDVSIAKMIAATIRESSGSGLKGVKAIGWWMEEYQCAQVSTNIIDVDQADLKLVFDRVQKEALKYDVEVKRSELIGMIPQSVILEVGRKVQPQEENVQILIQSAYKYLGLQWIEEERILEKRMAQVMYAHE